MGYSERLVSAKARAGAGPARKMTILLAGYSKSTLKLPPKEQSASVPLAHRVYAFMLLYTQTDRFKCKVVRNFLLDRHMAKIVILSETQ